jgi:hypothetical protein
MVTATYFNQVVFWVLGALTRETLAVPYPQRKSLGLMQLVSVGTLSQPNGIKTMPSWRLLKTSMVIATYLN